MTAQRLSMAGSRSKFTAASGNFPCSFFKSCSALAARLGVGGEQSDRANLPIRSAATNENSANCRRVGSRIRRSFGQLFDSEPTIPEQYPEARRFACSYLSYCHQRCGQGLAVPSGRGRGIGAVWELLSPRNSDCLQKHRSWSNVTRRCRLMGRGSAVIGSRDSELAPDDSVRSGRA